MSDATGISMIRNLHLDVSSRTCCDKGCRLRIDAKDAVILCGEKLEKQNKICDCIVFHQSQRIAMVELKSSSLHVADIVEQFRNGGKRAQAIAVQAGMNHAELYFILVAKKYGNHSAAGRLLRTGVVISNKKYRIRLCKCGDSISKAWKQMAYA